MKSSKASSRSSASTPRAISPGTTSAPSTTRSGATAGSSSWPRRTRRRPRASSTATTSTAGSSSFPMFVLTPSFQKGFFLSLTLKNVFENKFLKIQNYSLRIFIEFENLRDFDILRTIYEILDFYHWTTIIIEKMSKLM